MNFKKSLFVMVITGAILVGGVTTFAASGNMSNIESKWLEFRKAVTEKMVEDGKITQDEADKRIADLETRLAESEDDIICKRFCKPNGGSFNNGFMGKGRIGIGNMPIVDIYAELSGMTPQELIEKSKTENKCVGILAEEAGLVDELKLKLIENVTEKINEMVEDGRMTQEKADEIIEKETDRINNSSAEELGKGMMRLQHDKKGLMPNGVRGVRPMCQRKMAE